MDMKKLKWTTEELYGISPLVLLEMKYGDALDAKVKGARKQLRKVSTELQELLSNPMDTEARERYSKLSFHQDAILKAIEFNEELIKELR